MYIKSLRIVGCIAALAILSATVVTANAQTTEDVFGTLKHTIREPAWAQYAIVADWDSDGRNEIVALYGRGDPTAPNGYVAAYEFDGEQYVQEFKLNSPTWRPNIVDVGDVNGDGKNDIVVGTTDGDAGGYIYVISNGSIVWTSNWIGSFRANTGLAVGNTDDDSEAEIAVAVNWYGRYLTLYDHVGGNNFTEVFRLYEGDGLSVDIGDIDGDGKNEVVYGMGAWNGSVKAFEFNGVGYSRLWDVQVWYPKRAIVKVGDTDNDGTDEIVVGWGKYTDSRITIMEGSSVVWWGGPYGTAELPFRPRPAVGSLLNNGRNQIAFAVRRPGYWAIRLVEYDGVTYQDIGVVDRDNTVPVWGESLFIGDPDNDGLNELVFVENPGYPMSNDHQISIYTFQVAPVPATVDIEPDTLNVKSEGKWVTAYTELPEGYDVDDIDVSTVTLEGTIPAEAHPTEVDDHDNDGIHDLMVKFDRQALIEYLGGATGEVTLTVSGELSDGAPFEGSDTITVINP